MTQSYQMEALIGLFDLSNSEWLIIAPLLPGAEGKNHGRLPLDDRMVLNGIFFVLRTGTPWRDLPTLWPLHDDLQPLQSLGQERASGYACSRPWPPTRRNRCS